MASKISKLKKIKITLFWIVISFTFVLASTALVVVAFGYRLDYQTKTIEQTALLVVKTTPKDATVYLDDSILDKPPIRMAGLVPGVYDIKIQKDGYITWLKTVDVEGGLAYDFDSVVLFKQNPVIEKVANPPAEGIGLAAPDSNLLIDGGEIWYKDELVTRLSRDILNAVVYPDKNHIVFQVRDEIRVIEIDGGNNTLLVKLGRSDKTVFEIKDNDTLLFKDGDIIKQAKIL